MGFFLRSEFTFCIFTANSKENNPLKVICSIKQPKMLLLYVIFVSWLFWLYMIDVPWMYVNLHAFLSSHFQEEINKDKMTENYFLFTDMRRVGRFSKNFLSLFHRLHPWKRDIYFPLNVRSKYVSKNSWSLLMQKSSFCLAMAYQGMHRGRDLDGVRPPRFVGSVKVLQSFRML